VILPPPPASRDGLAPGRSDSPEEPSAAPAALDPQRVVREEVWASLRSVARPDSRFHWDFSSFIADFEGSEACAERVRALASWERADLLFITPDNSTEAVRRRAIEEGRRFLMTTYGIRRGFLLLEPGCVGPGEERYAATLDGMDALARPVSLAEISRLGRIGLLVTGGSAVNLEGLRIGKGHGYFDLEWALLSEADAVETTSEIVDVVHDCQVVDLPIDRAAHDVRVDWIVTPTRTIRVDAGGHPLGKVLWELVAGTEFEQLPPVVELARQREGGAP
jgi:5-formyltetrahydrofolate cyclo-ligase